MTQTLRSADAAARCSIGVDLPDGTALGLLLPPDDVAELVRSARVSAVPNAQPWFVGLINRRGNLVPVFDLLHYFDLAPRAASRDALVVGSGAAAFALPVSTEPRILPADAAASDPGDAVPPAAIAAFVTAAHIREGRCWCEFRFDRWLARLAAGVASDPLPSTSRVEKPT